METNWAVEDRGNGVYLFRWNNGLYISPFIVTSDGVAAIDPISRVAAVAYREAIASVTPADITHLIYSHDHRDHIVGGDVLVSNAEVIGHELTREHILRRRDPDILPVSKAVSDGDRLDIGRHTIEFHYFGRNHSDSSLGIILPAGQGPLLVMIDLVEPGVAPYRDLPDTDLAGLIKTLDRADKLHFTQVVGGHAGPDDRVWVKRNYEYLTDLLEATRQAYQESGGPNPQPGEDNVMMAERFRTTACRLAAEKVREKYGQWRGFDAWAPRTADRMLTYLILGN